MRWTQRETSTAKVKDFPEWKIIKKLPTWNVSEKNLALSKMSCAQD